jgi:hypothetical protein
MLRFKVDQQKDIAHAISNKIYFNSEDFKNILTRLGVDSKNDAYVEINNYIYLIDTTSYVNQGTICLSKLQRENLMLSSTMDHAKVTPLRRPKINFELSLLKVECKPFKLDYFKEIKETDINKFFRKLYQNHFFAIGQSLYFDYKGIQIIARIIYSDMNQTGIKGSKIRKSGMLTEHTDIEFSSTDLKKFKIKSDATKVINLN